jgi:tRNA-dihydrouridine synthase B
MYQLEETGRQRQAVAGYFDQLAAQSERLEYEALLAEDAAPV